jgi:hypothetical protein
MSEVKRVTTETEEYVAKQQKQHESWMEALERLLGIQEPPLTEERVEEIVEDKIKKMRYG